MLILQILELLPKYFRKKFFYEHLMSQQKQQLSALLNLQNNQKFSTKQQNYTPSGRYLEI